jgi:hypothetical protein
MNTPNYRIPLTVSGALLLASPILFIFFNYANAGLFYLIAKLLFRAPGGGRLAEMVALYGNGLALTSSLAAYYFATSRFARIMLSVLCAFFACSLFLCLLLDLLRNRMLVYFMPYVFGALLTALVLCGIERIKPLNSASTKG